MTTELNKIQFVNVNSSNNTTRKVAFKGTTDAIPNDTVELSTKKKEMSNGTKYGIGLGVLATLALTGLLIFKKKGGAKSPVEEWKKPILEKLKFTPLKENILFKEATSIEEARKFTSEQLNIADIDRDIPLNLLNWINRGLTDVSNASKGKVKMPTAIKLYESNDKVYGAMECYYRSEDFGTLYINKLMLSENGLNKFLDRILVRDGKPLLNNGRIPLTDVNVSFTNRAKELVEKYYKNKLTYLEKIELSETLNMFADNLYYATNTNPMKTFELLSKKHPELKLNLEEFSKKAKSEQVSELRSLLESLVKSNKSLTLEISNTQSPYRTIYHELGHLHDAVNNTENIISQNQSTEIYNWINRFDSIKAAENDIKRGYIKEYPKDLNEFINNLEIQQTAGEVSVYAQTGICEFTAETYAAMIEGKPLSEKVKALYKKYNGPELTNPPKTLGENIRFYKV